MEIEATCPMIAEPRTNSPWTIAERVGMVCWELCWWTLCHWTPKPWNRWRLFWLKMFGATVSGNPFVHQRTRIQIPWNVALADRCCLGDRASLYSLGRIVVGEGAVIAQEAYLCTGTHDFTMDDLPLVTKPIAIGRGAFIGARVFVLPGVTIGEGAIVGACAVVTADVAPFTVNAGNPSRYVGPAPRRGMPLAGDAGCEGEGARLDCDGTGVG